MEVKHIFIINNRQTFDLSNEIIRIFDLSQHSYVRVLVNKKFRAGFDSVDYFFFSDSFSVFDILNNIKAIGFVKRCLNNGANVYVPNADNILCNYLLRFASGKVSILVEGMLAYSGKRLNLHGKHRILKYLVALFYRINYKIFDVDLSGIDWYGVNKIYSSTHVGLEKFNEKIIEIPLRKHLQANFSSEKKCLIIGQYYHELINNERYALIVDRFRVFLSRLSVNKFDYLPHPLAKKRDPITSITNVNSVVADCCAEEFFSKDGYSVCVSISSTALFNIKIIYGGNVLCYSIGMDLIDARSLGDLNELKKVFSNVGVEFF